MPISLPIQIDPKDLNPSVGVGVDIPFDGDAVFKSNYETKNAIKNNLINYFLTNVGERFMNPTFGGGLRDFIFEQIENNNIEYLREDMQTKINNNFPRVQITELDITAYEDDNAINIKLQYRILNSNMIDSLEMDFNQ